MFMYILLIDTAMDTDIANQLLLIHQKFKDIDNSLLDLSNRVQTIDERYTNLCISGITR